MNTRIALFLPALGMAAFCLAASVPAAAEDAKVASRLDSEGVKYIVDDDGDYQVTFEYADEGRTQLAYVSGTTETVNGLTVREIFAPAGRVDENGITGEKALELMATSSTMKLGSWEVRGNYLVFVLKVLDSASASEMNKMLNIAAEAADNMEIELSGTEDSL